MKKFNNVSLIRGKVANCCTKNLKSKKGFTFSMTYITVEVNSYDDKKGVLSLISTDKIYLKSFKHLKLIKGEEYYFVSGLSFYEVSDSEIAVRSDNGEPYKYWTADLLCFFVTGDLLEAVDEQIKHLETEIKEPEKTEETEEIEENLNITLDELFEENEESEEVEKPKKKVVEVKKKVVEEPKPRIKK